MAGIAKAQTTKQAKAAFAARGRPSLNPKEQRQLERSLELEQRAEKAKEQEKRRLAAAKKRAESETKSKAEKEKAFLGTQRRKDRFGYVSSQFHLGAWMVGGKKAATKDKEVIMQEVEMVVEEEDDLFGDEELDDEDMLNALDVPANSTVHKSEHPKSDSAMFMPPPPVPPSIRRSQSAPVMDDMGDFWDDLESSTQIARELGDVEEGLAEKSTSTRSASFGSVDFDLTAEDLDELDPPAMIQQLPPSEKQMMPPPLPMKTTMLPPSAARRPNNAPPQSLRPNPAIQKPAHAPVSAMAPPARPPSVMSPPLKPVPTMAPPAPLKPVPTMAPPAPPESVPTTAPPAKPVARPTTSNATNPHTYTKAKEVQPKPSFPMPPPPPPRRAHDTAQQTKPRNAIKGPFLPASSLYCSPDLGFTLTQLESFVDDDIQLTQAVPG